MNRPQRILAYIARYQQAHGYPPMRAEIARELRVTDGSLGKPLRLLEKLGIIHRLPGRQRNIRLVTDSDKRRYYESQQPIPEAPGA
jgi:repressor LexA